MPLTAYHYMAIWRQYLLLFLACGAYSLLNGLWFIQTTPTIYNIPPDGTAWMLMMSGFQNTLANHRWLMLLADVMYYASPLIVFMLVSRRRHLAWLCYIWFAVSLIYSVFFTLFPTNSIEAHIAFILFPLVFAAPSLSSFYFRLHALRYFVLYFFVSAALWKIYQGGLFNPQQMSAVLLSQHVSQLVSDGQHWYSRMIFYLVNHPTLSFAIYLFGTLAELSFVAGFFTRRFDKTLIIVMLTFLLLDVLFMKIVYASILPFMLPLWYSQYSQPK